MQRRGIAATQKQRSTEVLDSTSPPTKKHAPAPAGACDPFKLHYSVPVSGSVVDLTAIYTKFTNGSGNYATYQLTLNTDRDVVVK